MSDRIVAYIVLSHREPAQVERLIRRIRRDSPASLVVSHHDPATSELRLEAFADDDRVVRVTPPIAGSWGDYRVLTMELRAMEQLYESGKRFDWVVLLSGQDYPIKPLAAFEAMLPRLGDGELEEHPDPALIERYSYAWYRVPKQLENRFSQAVFKHYLSPLNTRQSAMRFISGRAGCRFGFRTSFSPLPAGMTFRKGAQWWTLSERCVRTALAFSKEHPRVMDWYSRTIIPDESFFQTVLAGDPRFCFSDTPIRYIRWADATSPSPATLTSADIADLAASPAFFARKFDCGLDGAVLDEIDRTLLRDGAHITNAGSHT